MGPVPDMVGCRVHGVPKWHWDAGGCCWILGWLAEGVQGVKELMSASLWAGPGPREFWGWCHPVVVEADPGASAITLVGKARSQGLW